MLTSPQIGDYFFDHAPVLHQTIHREPPEKIVFGNP